MILRKKQKNHSLCAFAIDNAGITFVRASNAINGKPTITNFEFLKGETGVHPLLLKNIEKKYKLKKSPCTICLHPEDYRLVVCDTPTVPKKDLIDALQWEIKELIEIPLEDLTLDTFDIPDQVSAKQSINVVAAKKSSIFQLNDLFKEAKLNLEIIEIEEMAIRNLAVLHETSNQGQVILWLSQNFGKILFIKNKSLYLCRNIDIGEHNIEHLVNGMENIALEIQRSLDYFDRHFSHTSIHELLVMPLQSPTKALVEYLNNNLAIHCADFDIKSIIDGLEDIENFLIANNIVSIGIAFRNNSLVT